MPTSVISSTTRSATCRRDNPICSSSASAICQPTGNTGFSDDIGSWNTTEMSLPRMSRTVSIGSDSRLRPPNSTRLSGATIAFSGSNLTIDIALTLLPDPDSPTSATVEFSGMSKLTPRTASAMRCLPSRNDTRRSRTETRLLTCAPRVRDRSAVARALEAVSIGGPASERPSAGPQNKSTQMRRGPAALFPDVARKNRSGFASDLFPSSIGQK